MKTAKPPKPAKDTPPDPETKADPPPTFSELVLDYEAWYEIYRDAVQMNDHATSGWKNLMTPNCTGYELPRIALILPHNETGPVLDCADLPKDCQIRVLQALIDASARATHRAIDEMQAALQHLKADLVRRQTPET